MTRKKNPKKKVMSSIEPSSAKSYSSASGRFFHSGSHFTVSVNKKLTFRCCRNDRATMRIILRKRSQHEKSHAVYTVRARVRGRRVTFGTKVTIV